MSRLSICKLLGGILASACVGCHALTIGETKMRWEDNYRRALSTPDLLRNPEARRTVELSRTHWESHPAYRQLHKLAQAYVSGYLRSSIRLEVGNANEESYYGIWFIEDSKKVRLYFNPIDTPDSVRWQDVSTIQYQQLWKELERSHIWDLKSDLSRTRTVFDGTAFFVSVYRGEQSHQFVTYAPDLDSKSLDPHGRAVGIILNFVKGK